MKGVAVSRRPVRLLVTVLIALLAAGLLAAAPTNAAPPVVEHHQVLETDTTTDLNICGDLAVFKFNIRGEFTVVASDNLFHYQDNFHGTTRSPSSTLRSACGNRGSQRPEPPR
jgi:hypothetical protein